MGILFPSRCALCLGGLPYDQTGLCRDCLSKITALKTPQCRLCGAEFPPYSGRALCRECRSRRRFFSQGKVRLRYNKTLRELIQKIKYSKRFELAPLIGRQLAAIPTFTEKIDFVTAVPMTYSEKFKREISLSEIFAKRLAREWGAPYRALLRKRRATAPQAGLSRKERLRNLEDAFEIRYKKGLINRNILVVDDVLTTGATLEEASKTLKEAGAKKVFIVALARAGRYENS